MRHYWRYFKTLMGMSFASMVQYRLDFMLRIIRSIFELVVGWITIETLFQNTVVVGGWTRSGMLLVYTLALLVVALVMFVSGSGLESFFRKIQEGTLDYDLTRPMDTQWLASVWVMYITNTFRIFFSGVAFVWVLLQANVEVAWWQWVYFGYAFIASLLLYYCLMFLGSLVSFWSVSPEMFYIFNSVTSVIRYPVDMFPVSIRFILSVLPMLFITTIPVKILLGNYSWVGLLSLPVALITFWLTRQIWKKGLLSYQSASS